MPSKAAPPTYNKLLRDLNTALRPSLNPSQQAILNEVIDTIQQLLRERASLQKRIDRGIWAMREVVRGLKELQQEEEQSNAQSNPLDELIPQTTPRKFE